MNDGYIKVEQSLPLCGEITLSGAKNAVLVIIASLLLTRGKSVLMNVPCIADVFGMCELLQSLGATIVFDEALHILEIDTSCVNSNTISSSLMQKMRTSVLVMGPLLAQHGSAAIKGMPGGDAIGARPIDYHLKNFIKLGVSVAHDNDTVHATAMSLQARRIILEYPSVGATENILMLATKIPGITHIINAAIEPEVVELITVLKKMGARITITAPATIVIEGVSELVPVHHELMLDRLEAGSVLIAAAATGGEIYIPHACAEHMDLFLYKLEEMGHHVAIGRDGRGIHFKATALPQAVSFKTSPYPGFPTDLQAPMMALQVKAVGKSVIEETVFENRFLHIPYLQKMGAFIEARCHKAVVHGVQTLHGAYVVASDIRASMALVIAGLIAEGTTIISGVSHWKRGYDKLEHKLVQLGASITVCEDIMYEPAVAQKSSTDSQVM